MKIKDKSNEIYVIMFSLQSLQNQGITVKEATYGSLNCLLQWYRQTGSSRYLEAAAQHMQAYANMGFALDDREPDIKELLSLMGKTREDFVPQGQSMGKRVKVNKSQIRGMIGRWRSSKENPMTIGELVEDIIDKVSNHKEGRYIYQYRRKLSGSEEEAECYELVINQDESYFYDAKNFRFYTFLGERNHASSCNSG